MIHPGRLLLSLAICALGFSQKKPELVDRVQQVRLNLVAFDGSGKPVGDLTARDLEIEDEGRPQRIAYFERVEAGSAQPTGAALPATGSHIFSNRPSINGARPALFIVFDLMNRTPRNPAIEADQESLSKVLENLDSGENVFLYLLATDGKMYPVRGLPDVAGAESSSGREWTRQSRTLLEQALAKANQLKPIEESDRERANLGAGLQIGRMLWLLSGRKNVILLSQGAALPVASGGHERAGISDTLTAASFALNFSNAAMFTVGEDAAPGQRDRWSFLQTYANLTGGKSYPHGHVADAIHDALASPLASYRILYDPGRDNWNRKLHNVRVNCTRKGVQILVQRAYLAVPRDANEESLKRRFNLTAFGPKDAPGVGLRATVTPGTKPDTAHVEVRIDVQDLALVQNAREATGQLAIGIFGITGGRFEVGTPVLMDVSLNAPQFSAALREGILFQHDKKIPSGMDKMRIVVLDMSASHIGSLTVSVPQTR